jgi:2-C-methyl-D-erythritol 4-phosphate cytidylyltransferase
MPKFAVILPAAGKSSRFGDATRKKPFVDLKGRPVWLRAAEPFLNHKDVVQSIICLSPDDMEWFKEKFRPNLAFSNIEVIAGGAERVDSVLNALNAVRGEVDFVAVHDAARPLISKATIDAVFAAAVQHRAAIPAVPISSTIKRVGADQKISETVPREHLWAAQTPQVIERKLLLDAYAQRGKFTPTDEAQLVERIGIMPAIVEGSPMNLKITTAADMRMAEALVDAVPRDNRPRTLHPFSDESSGLFD